MLLVTGCSGLLGSAVLLRARDQGREVVGLCYRNPLDIPGVPVHGVDLTDFGRASEFIAALRPSAIIHCAAAANVDWCEQHPADAGRINVLASSALADVARRMAAKFVYISTDSVFDGETGHYHETDTPVPVNAYAQSKLDGEREVFERLSSALIVRTTIYGWNAQNKTSLAEWVVSELASGKAVPGFTDVFFCPMLTDDLADILLAMLDSQLAGVYHVVGEQRVSKYEFARAIAEEFGFDPMQVTQSKLSDARLKARRPRDTSLVTDKISVALERPMPDVAQGLRRFRDLRDRGHAGQLKSYLAGATK